MGKVLEQLICTRLERAINDSGGLSPSQYGFRRGMSTVDDIGEVVRFAMKAAGETRWKGGKKEYCLLVPLDIKNAFNSVRRDCILSSLQRKRLWQMPSVLELIERKHAKWQEW